MVCVRFSSDIAKADYIQVVRALLTHVPRSSFPPSTGSCGNIIVAIGLNKSVLLGVGCKSGKFHHPC